MQIVWRNVALFVMLHIGALVGLYQILFTAKWPSVVGTVPRTLRGDGEGTRSIISKALKTKPSITTR